LDQVRQVCLVKFELRLRNGKKRVVEFHDRQKIEDLLTEDTELGVFLRDILLNWSARD
jgi:hypothetical protein